MKLREKIETREDMIFLLLDILRPLKDSYSEGHAFLHVGNTAAHYGEKAARMEGYSRVLWGVGPLLATENTEVSDHVREEILEWENICREGLIHGTDPDSDEYWGEVCDYSQMMVEMAAIVNAILLARRPFWTSLQDIERQHIYQWLNQINAKEVHPNNWRFFRILVNVLFQVLELPWNEQRLQEDLAVIEHCYDGDGWYFDGNPGQLDYYIPFAMHYYGLLYATHMESKQPEYSKELRERAGKFYQDFIYWFGSQGAEIPYGRSLTYRFAHSAFFSAVAYAGVENIDLGEVKGLLLRNMRYWMRQPIFDEKGILSIGYGYPNLFMSERYNAPGSPYWSLKTFLILALNKDHPFWKAEEKPLQYEQKKVLQHPHMLITTSEEGHVLAYPTGQHCMNHGNSAAKYEKFVYSNEFGFSVSRGTNLDDGAFDNTLAAAELGDTVYRMRYGVETFSVTDSYTKTTYRLMPEVEVESIIIPLDHWHIRIHEIKNNRAIRIADGGFAIGVENTFNIVSGSSDGKYTEDMIQRTNQAILCQFPWGRSGALSYSDGNTELIHAFPNTNLFANLTVIPTICQTLQPGKHLIINAFCADQHQMISMKDAPRVEVVDQQIKICYKGEMKILLLRAELIE